MQAIGSSLPRFFDAASPTAQPQYAGITHVGVLSASSQQNLNLSLVTAEGDKVTISDASSMQIGVGSYDYRGQLNGNVGTLQENTVQATAEDSFSIAVAGNLSKDELDDIKKLVEKLEHVGADLFTHPLNDSALETLGFGNDLNSIASFDATVSATQQVTVAQEAQQEDVSVAESAAPQAGEVATLESDAPKTTRGLKNFVDKLLSMAKDANVDKEKFAGKLPEALARLLRRLSSASSHDERDASDMRSLRPLPS